MMSKECIQALSQSGKGYRLSGAVLIAAINKALAS